MPESLKRNAEARRDPPDPAFIPLPHDSIQAHGLLLVLSEPDLVIRQISQNCASIIGKPADMLLGHAIEVVLGRAQRAALEKTTRAGAGPISERSLRFTLAMQGERRQFNAFAHRRDGQLVLELEPAKLLAAGELARLLNQATAALAAIECEFDAQRLQQLAVTVLRAILRYDRMVFYRIDEDGNGEVIAEDRSPQTSLPSMLGRMVAGDGPVTSRIASARRRRLREERDVRARGIPMIPALNPVTGAHLSLRHSFLYAWTLSPQRRYVLEDSVRGKMRVAVNVDGRLWGLLIGHHEKPRTLPRELRQVCLDISQALSRQISAVRNREALQRHSMLTQARERLIAGIAQAPQGLHVALARYERELLEAPNANGAALWWEGRLSLYGRTPGAMRTAALAHWLQRERPYAPMGEAHLPAYATRALQQAQPERAEFHGIAGVVAVPLGGHGCLMWFRDAQVLPADAPRAPRSASWTAGEIASVLGFTQLGWVAGGTAVSSSDAYDEHLRSVIENLAHGVIIYSAQGAPLLANSAVARIYGLSVDELLNALVTPGARHLRADGSELPLKETPMQLVAVSGEAVTDYRMGIRQDGGSIRWTTVTCRAIYDKLHGRRLVVSLHDVSEQQRIERDLQTLAHFDALTGLPNRALLKERLDQAIARAREAGAGNNEEGGATHTHVGIILVGLDRFKEINDSLGNAAGDQVLQEVARRLNLLLGNANTVARFGGDEFAVLAEDDGRDQIMQIATRSRDALDAPTHVDGNEIFIGCSIGVSMFPDDGGSRDELLKNADIAMNEAKAEGGNGVRMFSRELQARSSHELSVATKLRRALERGELHIAYQPQVSLATNQIQGLEALMRWDHPELGSVPPAQFIRIAEETGLILPMGEWLLKTACEDLRSWQAADLPPVTVAINLSARQFRDRQLASKIAAALAATDMDARWLEFEITESVIMQDTPHNIETLEQLASLGAKMAIDDFGTGYSSLAYLKRFPVHMLKIDRTFVRDISTDRDDAAIVRTIIGLAHSLELGVVAEGVETEDQLRFLAQLNCDVYQGYYFSRPVPAAEIVKLLQG